LLPAPYFNQNRTPNLAKLVFIFLSLIFLSARFSDYAIRQWPESKRSDPGNSSNAAQVKNLRYSPEDAGRYAFGLTLTNETPKAQEKLQKSRGSRRI
jgi:hypothetical protein